jgi:RNA polymerase sigma factor (sigma-70 family)
VGFDPSAHTGLVYLTALAALRACRVPFTPADLEDATQDAMLKLVRKGPLYDPARGGPATFVACIAEQAVRKYARRMQGWRYGRAPFARPDPNALPVASLDREAFDPYSAVDPPWRRLQRAEVSAASVPAVEALLRALPADMADVLRRYYGVGRPRQTLQQAADDLGLTRERIRQKVVYATKFLRRHRKPPAWMEDLYADQRSHSCRSSTRG